VTERLNVLTGPKIIIEATPLPPVSTSARLADFYPKVIDVTTRKMNENRKYIQ